MKIQFQNIKADKKISEPTGYFPRSNASVDYRALNVPALELPQIQNISEIKLTARRPSEILKMEFDPEDLYVDNGIFAKGQPLTILGPGGIGKSFLLFQMAVCSITGRDFIGWKVGKRPLRWLIIQAENCNRRIQADLEKLRKWVGEDAWKLIEENFIIHTLENDHDGDLSLNNPASAERISALIKTAAADVVAFDPLFAFAAGNLNADGAMNKTCRALTNLARLGKPDCALVVLHHTLTGKQGAKRATGFDRGSYGRNSKTLNSWTRGQINIAPANPEDNARLLICCGKNSNGPEFAPFGIRRDPETMIFEIDTDFDLETWKNELSGATNAPDKPTHKTVAELVLAMALTKNKLVKVITAEFGCKKSTAYTLIGGAEGKTIRRNGKNEYEALAA